MNIPQTHFEYLMAMPWAPEMLSSLAANKISAQEVAELSPVTANSHMMAMSYLAHGSQIYALDPALQAMLSCTSLKNVSPEDVRLPFPAFYVSCEDSPFVIDGGETGQHTISGFYVTSITYESDDDRVGVFPPTKTQGFDGLHFHFWANENENRRFQGDDASVWFTLDYSRLCEEFGGDWQLMIADMASCWKRDEDPFAAIVEKVLGQTEDEIREWVEDGEALSNDPIPAEYNADQLQSLVRLGVNFLLYLTSERADVQSGLALHSHKRVKLKKRLAKAEAQGNSRQIRKLERKLDEIHAAHVTYVGPGLHRSQDGREFLKAFKERGDARVHAGRIYVSGHFQRYWVGSRIGPEGEERPGERQISKWKEPYIKNADAADMVQKRIHKVV